MPKDRLGELLAAREDFQELEQDESAANSKETHENINDFYKYVEELNEMIDEVEEQVARVKKKYNEILMSARTEQLSRQELEDLTSDIKSNAQEIRKNLFQMEEGTKVKKVKYNADSRIREIQHAILTRRFVEVMTEYNKTQTDFRESCKKRILMQYEITGRRISKEQLEEMLEKEDSSVFTEGIITETLQMKQSLADIEARHSDIVKLEISIREVHDMFVEMALLVADQSEKIDRIEYHVENACDYVEYGKYEIRKGKNYAAKARRKKIMLIICLSITLVILIIMFILYVAQIFR